VGDNEQMLSVLRFTLVTNGYRVLVALGGQEAVAIFATTPLIDLVVAYSDMVGMSGSQLAERLKVMRRWIPILLLGDLAAGDQAHTFEAVMASVNCTSFELLERAKVMSARKRGPRKGIGRAPSIMAPAAVA
jgi:CheY-like chemotaxis protein